MLKNHDAVMTTTQVFLKPSLHGGRFENCTIPLEFLKDLAVFEEMVVEIAKSEYRKDNPERQRIPRDFVKGIEIGLTAIEAGSTKPIISLIVTAPLLFSPAAPYFEKASESIVNAIQAASEGKNVSDHIPEEAIPFFDRFGRGLRDGESLTLPASHGKTAILTKETRKKILLASPKLQKYSEECVVRGMIPEIDQDTLSCQLLLLDGRRITIPYTAQHERTILDAVVGYRDKQTKVMLKGVGIVSRQGRLQEFESLESIEILDPLDIFIQIEGIRLLKDGWMDGEGKAPSHEVLERFAQTFDRYWVDSLPLPHIYPTFEGGIQAEWLIGRYAISLEIELPSQKSYYHQVHLDTKKDSDIDLDLTDHTGWETLSNVLHTVMKEDGK